MIFIPGWWHAAESQSSQSRRHGGALVGLDPKTKLQAPKLKYETL